MIVLTFKTISRSFKIRFLKSTFILQKHLITTDSESLTAFFPQSHKIKSRNLESNLRILRSFHFSDAQIEKLLDKSDSRLLKSKFLESKLSYFTDNGLAGPVLREIIVRYPRILIGSLSGKIKPAIEFLKKYLESNEKILLAIRRSSWLLTYDLKGNMQPTIQFLLSEGVPINNIAKLIVRHPRSILANLHRTAEVLETVKKLGLKPTSVVFLKAFQVKLGMTELTWNRKVQNLKSLGFSEEEIVSAFKRDPSILGCSEEKIRVTFDFYVNTIKLDREIIATYPKLLTYGVKTRLRPRHNAVKLLESMKLLKGKKCFSLFTLTERDFLKRCVEKHLDQVPNLMELYRAAISAK